ncbi:alpha/beta hydrolase [Tsukamurella soli]|uniref:Alpha/beta hydrolase n=1 Tax=Tsukamurella soli TaxID=644556 RepID=A0ABP8K6K6_9ACTN
MSDTATQTAPLNIEVDGLVMGGRVAEPSGSPRGLVIALHGGTYDSGYYDQGPDSLLALGSRLDYTVAAIDRPGYGGSAVADPGRLSFAAQTASLAAAVDRLAAEYPGPVVLIGHSIGGMIALQVAAATATPLAGVEVSGLGELWQPGIREMWASLIGDGAAVTLPTEGHAQVMLGPTATQAPDSIARDADLLRPLPMPELTDVVGWSDLLPAVAAAVAIPVSLTLAEHDNIWQSGTEAQALLAGHFTAAPLVRVDRFAGAGHSIELHRGARAYALYQLAFAAACISPVE